MLLYFYEMTVDFYVCHLAGKNKTQPTRKIRFSQPGKSDPAQQQKNVLKYNKKSLPPRWKYSHHPEMFMLKLNTISDLKPAT